MATWNYICKKCGKQFSMSGAVEVLIVSKPPCPDCHNNNNVAKVYTQSKKLPLDKNEKM